ncbi:MAG TPA: hypothetical protein VHZ04_02540 [Candidatus Paceibacterota bacterium]|jgi:hypothetical protein|nr:hypothetical protein [Candidatus Paceibacterota bacterium]
MPTSSITNATLTTPNQALQQLQASYGSTTQAITQNALNAYFSHLTILEVISAIISAAFIAATVYFLIETGYISNRVDKIRDVVLKKDISKEHARSSWADIERHFFAGDDNDLKIAIIEADNLLGEALHDVGVPGVNLGERLQRVNPEKLPNVEDVWQAHKIRNRIAHEANFVLKRDLAERALTVYEKALEHLGLLEPESELKNPDAQGSAGK